MSIYTTLAFEVPIIAYCTLHQARKGVKPDDYVSTMKDLHELLHRHTAEIRALWSNAIAIQTSHTVSVARRTLTPFLTTPLKSDEVEIDRMLSDHIRDLSSSLMPGVQYGLTASTEGRVRTQSNLSDLLPARLHTSGKSYLKELSFKTGKAAPEIFESNFFVEGGINLDVIEHIVRDRIGIYTPVHGKHIKEFAGYSYSAHNLIYLHGELKCGSATYESVLFFSKGETHYAPFRNALSALLDAIKGKLEIEHYSVWQRKLGLGVGREFVLRVRYSTPSALSELFKLVDAESSKIPVKKSLFSGHLLTKEIIL